MSTVDRRQKRQVEIVGPATANSPQDVPSETVNTQATNSAADSVVKAADSLTKKKAHPLAPWGVVVVPHRVKRQCAAKFNAELWKAYVPFKELHDEHAKLLLMLKKGNREKGNTHKFVPLTEEQRVETERALSAKKNEFIEASDKYNAIAAKQIRTSLDGIHALTVAIELIIRDLFTFAAKECLRSGGISLKLEHLYAVAPTLDTWPLIESIPLVVEHYAAEVAAKYNAACKDAAEAAANAAVSANTSKIYSEYHLVNAKKPKKVKSDGISATTPGASDGEPKPPAKKTKLTKKEKAARAAIVAAELAAEVAAEEAAANAAADANEDGADKEDGDELKDPNVQKPITFYTAIKYIWSIIKAHHAGFDKLRLSTSLLAHVNDIVVAFIGRVCSALHKQLDTMKNKTVTGPLMLCILEIFLTNGQDQPRSIEVTKEWVVDPEFLKEERAKFKLDKTYVKKTDGPKIESYVVHETVAHAPGPGRVLTAIQGILTKLHEAEAENETK